MREIGVITDGGAGFSQEAIKKYEIGVVPIKVFWPEIENLPGSNIFQKMREAERLKINSFGKTSQPSLKDFLDIFNEKLNNFEKIIGIFLSSKLSGTFNVANQARNFLKKDDQKRIFLIDSLNVSAGQALLVLKAIDLIKEDKSAEEISKDMERQVSLVQMIGIIPNTKWLKASGRISPFLANWMEKASKIGVWPVIKIKQGVLVPASVVFGTKEVPLAIFKKFEKEIKSYLTKEKVKVVISHGDDLKSALKLKEMAEKISEKIEVVSLNLIDDVIGSIAGPDTIAISWL